MFNFSKIGIENIVLNLAKRINNANTTESIKEKLGFLLLCSLIAATKFKRDYFSKTKNKNSLLKRYTIKAKSGKEYQLTFY